MSDMYNKYTATAGVMGVAAGLVAAAWESSIHPADVDFDLSAKSRDALRHGFTENPEIAEFVRRDAMEKLCNALNKLENGQDITVEFCPENQTATAPRQSSLH